MSLLAKKSYNAIRYMQKGDISTAFRTSDMNGNEMCKIIKLVDVIPAHKATLDEDYLRLEQIALEQKQQKVFQKWLDAKIEAMYVYISPEFRYDDFVNKSWIKKETKNEFIEKTGDEVLKFSLCVENFK